MAKDNVFGDTAHHRKDVRIEETIIIISIEDEAYQTIDWSLGGFRIGGYRGSIRPNSEFMVDGIGPDLETIFAVRVDCKAIRITEDRLSASFIEIDSDVYDILEALMLRREKPIEKLKERLPHHSLASRFLDLAAEDIDEIYEAYWKLVAAEGDRLEEISRVYQEVHKLKSQSEKIDYGLLTAIADGLCQIIDKPEKVGPKEIEAVKIHIDAMKLVISKNIRGSGGKIGKEIMEGLQQVRDRCATGTG